MIQEEREVAIKYNEFAKVLMECCHRIEKVEADDPFILGMRVVASTGLLSIATVIKHVVENMTGLKSS